MSGARSKRKPSKREQERRRRQSAGERSAANRAAKRRQRERGRFRTGAIRLLGTDDPDEARVRLYEDAALLARLLAELADVPELRRGQAGEPDPKGYAVHVESVDPRHRLAEASAHLSAAGSQPDYEDDDSPGHGRPGVEDLKNKYKEIHRRDDIDQAAEDGWEGMAADAAVMLAASKVATDRQARGVYIGSVQAAKRFCPYGSAERMGKSLKVAYDAHSGSYSEAACPPHWVASGENKDLDYHNRLFTLIDATSSTGDWEADWMNPESGL